MLQDKLKEKGFIFSDKYFKNSSYLFPDGTFLNLDEQKIKIDAEISNNVNEFHCHSDLDSYIKFREILDRETINKLKQQRGSYDAPSCVAFCNIEILKFTDNVIVLNSGVYKFYDGNYIDLPPKELTIKQYEALTTYLDELSYTKPLKKLQVAKRDKVIKYELTPEEVDNIIKEIKKLYNIEKD